MDKKLILIQDHKPLCSIVFPREASATEKFAANELQRYLFLMSKARAEIVSESNPVRARKAILVGRCSSFPRAEQISEEENDTVIIRTFDSNTLFLGGNNQRSVLYAVYTFLEELGCRWVYPTKSEQVVPAKKTIALGYMDKRITARLKLRGIDLEPLVKRELPITLDHIDWMAKNRFNMLSTHPGVYGTDLWSTDIIRWESVKEQILPELKKRGMLLNMNVHNLFYFLPPERYYQEHPEWFSVRDEGYRDSDSSDADVIARNLIRYFEDSVEIIHPYDLGQKIYPKWLSFEKGHQVPSQICYSNEDAVRTYTRNVLAYVETHPEVDILGLWPADGGNFCQCERCRRDPFVILKVVNNIAKEIYRMNKNLIVEHIVYGERSRQVPPEDIDISPNLIVFVCYDGYKEWLPWLKRNVKQGFYKGEYDLGDNYANRGVVYLKPEQAKRWADSLVEDGFWGFSSFYIETSSWWRSTFNYWFLSKAGFEGVANVEEMLKDYCDSYFGRFSGKAYEILSALLFEVQYPEGAYATDIPPVEGVAGENEKIFSRIEKEISALEKEIEKDNHLSSRLKNLHTYVAFVRASTAAHFLRGEALLAEKGGNPREVIEKMLEVARIEEHMQRLCQESFLNNDGVLDNRLYISRKKWRFLEDKRMLERVSAFSLPWEDRK